MIDYRVKIGVQQHPKIVKLKRRHGAEGVLALFRLWEYTAMNCSKGVLHGLDDESVAIASNWNGGMGWVDDLVELHLLDVAIDGIYSIHDWKDHNRYAYFAEERSEQAKKAIDARWNKKYKGNQEANTDSITKRTTECNTPSPLPSPLPTNCISPHKGADDSGPTLAEAKGVSGV